jgi:phosphoribosyl-ATP pyrophosphohydrolase/phosphoribosyl-AMP cyclohydrolase
MSWLDEVPWNEHDLVAVVTQDFTSGKILTVAWMNREALQQTAEKKEAVYYSRSRKRLWRKGEESGNIQKVKEIRIDCDADAVLLKVEQVGGIACHTAQTREREMGGDGSGAAGSQADLRKRRQEMKDILDRIAASIEERKDGDPEKSYVAKLFSKGDDAMLKKIGEEATEVVLAAKSGDRLHLVREVTDLWFHCMIVLARHGLGPNDVLAEMQRREGISGLDEKASRKK